MSGGVLRQLVVRFVFQGNTNGINNVNNALGNTSSIAGQAGQALRGLLAAYLGFQGLSTVAKFVGHTNAEFERLNAALITATGSEAAAQEAFGRIEQFAATTPYELGLVTDAFIKLKNLGLNPSEEALTAYGNTASAMGKDLMQMIEAVADASTLEFERLKEFGIKTKQEGDNVIFTFRGVKTTVKKDGAAIEKYLIGLGQNQFAGGMARQAKTLSGVVSNLQDNLGRLARSMGKGGLWDALKRVAASMVDVTSGGDGLASSVGAKLGHTIDFVRQHFGKLVVAVKLAAGAFAAWRIGVLVQSLRGMTFTVAGLNAAINSVSHSALLMAPAFKTALIATGIGALVIAVALLAEDIYQFATGGESVIGALAEKFPAFDKAVDGLVAFFRLATPIVTDLWYGMLEGFSAAWQAMAPGLAMLGQAVLWLGRVLWEGLYNTLAVILPVIGQFFMSAAQVVLGFVEFLAAAWNDPQMAFWYFGQFIVTTFNAVADLVKAYLTAVVQSFQAAFGVDIVSVLSGLPAVFAATWVAIQDGVASFVQWVINKIMAIPTAIAGALGGLGRLAGGILGLTPGADAGARGQQIANSTSNQSITYNGGPISVTTNNPAAAGAAVNAGRTPPPIRSFSY